MIAKTIIVATVVYWLVTSLSFHVFAGEFEIVGMFFYYAIGPFILGLTMSMILIVKYGLIGGVLVQHIYALAISIRKFVYYSHVYDDYTYHDILSRVGEEYLYYTIPASIFVITGGLIGNYINKRLGRISVSLNDDDSS